MILSTENYPDFGRYSKTIDKNNIDSEIKDCMFFLIPKELIVTVFHKLNIQSLKAFCCASKRSNRIGKEVWFRKIVAEKEMQKTKEFLEFELRQTYRNSEHTHLFRTKIKKNEKCFPCCYLF